jgi:dTDP-4-amino-4,6-dideoxygalactose transaminase
MDSIMHIASKHGLFVIEDAAQGVMSKYKGRALGAIGDLGTYSFHETKNLISGEGGALLVNRQEFVGRSEVIREKGTDRSSFFRGEVDKYTWQDIGSSYLPGELIAAFLWAQLEEADAITASRREIWNRYHSALGLLEQHGAIRRPIIPPDCEHNGHMYYVLTRDAKSRRQVIDAMKEEGIGAIFHYIPLHDSPAGKRYGRVSGTMVQTENLSQRILRLPLWVGLSEAEIDRVTRILERVS